MGKNGQKNLNHSTQYDPGMVFLRITTLQLKVYGQIMNVNVARLITWQNKKNSKLLPKFFSHFDIAPTTSHNVYSTFIPLVKPRDVIYIKMLLLSIIKLLKQLIIVLGIKAKLRNVLAFIYPWIYFWEILSLMYYFLY